MMTRLCPWTEQQRNSSMPVIWRRIAPLSSKRSFADSSRRPKGSVPINYFRCSSRAIWSDLCRKLHRGKTQTWPYRRRHPRSRRSVGQAVRAFEPSRRNLFSAEAVPSWWGGPIATAVFYVVFPIRSLSCVFAPDLDLASRYPHPIRPGHQQGPEGFEPSWGDFKSGLILLPSPRMPRART